MIASAVRRRVSTRLSKSEAERDAADAAERDHRGEGRSEAVEDRFFQLVDLLAIGADGELRAAGERGDQHAAATDVAVALLVLELLDQPSGEGRDGQIAGEPRAARASMTR